jgi:hypothetical protein
MLFSGYYNAQKMSKYLPRKQRSYLLIKILFFQHIKSSAARCMRSRIGKTAGRLRQLQITSWTSCDEIESKPPGEGKKQIHLANPLGTPSSSLVGGPCFYYL